ncbi:MAG: Gldg family protein [Sphingobacterium sp.]|jgi:ABC-2 type transport system permease protein|nr:Gldg family protein [Sphingobacterium sp.]
MKLIYKIAQNEIRSLFYSPVAWFLGVAFWILCAYFYTKQICHFANYQELGTQNNPAFEGFTTSLTETVLLKGGLFNAVIGNLYFFLPLLTMGLISRELNNGTIKLLYSSPIKPISIILGKYLAIVFYCSCLLIILSVFLIASLFTIVHVDGGIVLSALLSLFLLICSYAAIGIFMSSLSTYQIVSGVATFLVIFVLSSIGMLWQQYDFIRDLTYFLSIAGRTERMLRGLITSSDVCYFILIIAMFLCFTYFKVKGATESKSFSKTLVQYGTVVVVILSLGYITSKPSWIGYLDMTRDNLNTIHPNVQAIIQKFDKKSPLKVTLYTNLLGRGMEQGGLPEQRKSYEMRLWEPYLRFKPDIQFEYVNYYDVAPGDSSLYKMYPNKSLKEIAEIMAKALQVDLKKFIGPEEIRKRIDLKPENLRLVMELEYQGRKTFLRTFEDGGFWPDQMNVSAAFKRLQQSELPKLLFTSGNLERSIYKTGQREYSFFARDINNRIGLINLGFDCDSIDLEHQDIPNGIAGLVIADPKTTLSAVKQAKIHTYLAKGGNAIFFGEPEKQDILNPLLAEVGAQFSPGTLVEVSVNETPDLILPTITKEGFSLSDNYKRERERLAAGKPVVQGGLPMRGTIAVYSIGNTDFKPFHILKTDSTRATYNKIGKLIIDSVPPVFNKVLGDTRQATYTTLLGLSRQKDNQQQRIIAAGDTDFLSNLRQGGGYFTVSLFSWLDNNRWPIYTIQPAPLDVLLTISNSAAETQRFVFLYIIPVVIVLIGIIVLIRRKRK